MRKTILPASILAAVMVSSTAFAASNPFSDVPAGHWAYNSVTKLASEGIIEGYGDGTFRGNRNITRYEMAQMVARALARYDSTGQPAPTAPANTRPINAATRAELDKLAAEFRDELDGLGVRVDELEKHADLVKWAGKIEYSYDHVDVDGEKDYTNSAIFRLEPSAEVNSHWTANARFDAEVDFRGDETTDAELKRIWAEGDYDKFNVKLGRMELFTNEEGLIWDTEFSGAQLSFGSNFNVDLLAGRLKSDEVGVIEEDGEHPTDLLGVNLQYGLDGGLKIGGGYYYLKDKDFRSDTYSNDGNTDKANIWSANLGYDFAENLSVFGAYAQNTKADHEKSAWHAQVTYGDYDDEPEKGVWGLWAGYRRYGSNVSFVPTTDDTLRGTKGWFVGAGYAPFKNVGVTARYFDGKDLTFDKLKVKHFLGKVEFFF